MKSPLKIAYVSRYNPHDKTTWSGAPYQTYHALKNNFDEVTYIGPIGIEKWIYAILYCTMIGVEFLTAKRYYLGKNILSSRYYGFLIEKRLKKIKYDLIFTPAGTGEVAFLNTTKPVFHFADSTYHQLINYYEFLTGLAKISIAEGNYIERLAINKSTGLIYTSQWAAESAISFYKADPRKICIAPFGANIEKIPSRESLRYRCGHKAVCRLLLIGVDWVRKGGDLAFEALVALNEMGVSTTLTVVGCQPRAGLSHPGMSLIPFLNKNLESDVIIFERLLEQSHFLLVPTRAECQGIVFCEASAYGLPSITTDTGGVAASVENGVNGYRLGFGASGMQYAELIRQVFKDDGRYERLVLSSRLKFDKDLNWQVWGSNVARFINERVKALAD